MKQKKKEDHNFINPFVAFATTKLGHNLPRLLRHLRHSLNLAELIRMLAQLLQDLVALLGRGGREVIIADSNHAGYNGNDLGEVLLE